MNEIKTTFYYNVEEVCITYINTVKYTHTLNTRQKTLEYKTIYPQTAKSVKNSKLGLAHQTVKSGQIVN